MSAFGKTLGFRVARLVLLIGCLAALRVLETPEPAVAHSCDSCFEYLYSCICDSCDTYTPSHCPSYPPCDIYHPNYPACQGCVAGCQAGFQACLPGCDP